ncbi:MAG TPA: M42 family metallopeptidase [Ignavibacteria bacterium]|nr:M42 family metallopeptidase [Ignavibacteria bacterium]HQY53166.1 M42 family metallopeptidase [Ignavibacteria bacterium]HRB01182.1 M42 family metallopeptidase [Ignavibacteria bacterium]
MDNVTSTLESLLKIHSPTGFTNDVIKYISSLFIDNKDIKKTLTNKGSLLISFDDDPELLLTAHIDTLGAMVKEVKGNGTLELTQLGSYPWNSFEGEYVTIRNSKGKLYRGTFLMNNPADHVNKNLRTEKREYSNMSVRIDEPVQSESDVKKLDIETGNFVFYDNRFEYTKSGFVKSRFLDDKACAAVLIELIKDLSKVKNKKKVGFYFSNYEEVGHGSAIGIPDSVKELLVLDMAVVGDGCSGSEDSVSICVKDSSGPYDFDVSQKLKDLAVKNKIKFNIDIYPYYGSDGSAALLAGYDVRVGLIGPGVSASHGVERTHRKGIAETYKLAKAYINNF